MIDLGSRYSDQELAAILDFQTQAGQALHEATLELRGQKPARRGKQPGGGKR